MIPADAELDARPPRRGRVEAAGRPQQQEQPEEAGRCPRTPGAVAGVRLGRDLPGLARAVRREAVCSGRNGLRQPQPRAGTARRCPVRNGAWQRLWSKSTGSHPRAFLHVLALLYRRDLAPRAAVLPRHPHSPLMATGLAAVDAFYGFRSALGRGTANRCRFLRMATPACGPGRGQPRSGR
jgi:hypothetical protein